MAVPKKRTSKAKRNMRRSHDSISAPSIINLKTGVYRGRQILETEEETTVE